MTELVLRLARADEADVITELCLRSKAHWGYDDAFMAACRDELTVTPEIINTQICAVAFKHDILVATYSVHGKGACREVECFFIDPPHIGTGLGRLLMEDCTTRAQAAGVTSLELDADPHAEAFYAAMGFETVSTTSSGSIPGRILPRMRRVL